MNRRRNSGRGDVDYKRAVGGVGVALWWAVDVDGFLALLGDAGVFAGVMAALVAVSGGFWLIARSYVVAKNGAMSYMMPAVVALAAMMATRKEIMEHAEFWAAIAVYCAVSIGISGVVNLSVFAVRSGCAKFCEVLGSRRTWKAGALMRRRVWLRFSAVTGRRFIRRILRMSAR